MWISPPPPCTWPFLIFSVIFYHLSFIVPSVISLDAKGKLQLSRKLTNLAWVSHRNIATSHGGGLNGAVHGKPRYRVNGLVKMGGVVIYCYLVMCPSKVSVLDIRFRHHRLSSILAIHKIGSVCIRELLYCPLVACFHFTVEYWVICVNLLVLFMANKKPKNVNNETWKMLRGYCTSGPYFWRLCAFSQKIKQLRTKHPMDLVRNVPRNSKITVLLQ